MARARGGDYIGASTPQADRSAKTVTPPAQQYAEPKAVWRSLMVTTAAGAASMQAFGWASIVLVQ